MKTVTRALICSSVIATAALFPTNIAFAKDAEPASPVSSEPGVCATEWTETATGNWYPLSNERFPGNVAVDISMSTGVPRATSVCVSPGWTYQAKSVTDGIDIRFFYNGERAIDFKYVLGKTVIRGY